MRLFGCLGLLTVMLQVSSATDALQFFSPLYPATGGSTNGAGFAFRPKSHLLITDLSYYPPPHVVGLNTTRVDIVTTSGQILASALITTNHPFTSAGHLEAIPPLVIPAGTTNFIRSYIWDEGFTNVPGVSIVSVVTLNQGTVAPELEYLGFGPGLNLSDYSTAGLFLGANFRFSVIPPVTLKITPTSSNYIQLSWSADAGDYVLHCGGPGLDSPTLPVVQLPELIGADRVVTLPLQSSNCFFRLVR